MTVGQPLVLDASAIAALLDAHHLLLRYWQRADDGDLVIVLPALAVAEAGRARQIGVGAWEPLLQPERVRVVPLGETAAVEIGTWKGELPACHALWEAIHASGIIVTCQPGLYEPGRVALLVV